MRQLYIGTKIRTFWLWPPPSWLKISLFITIQKLSFQIDPLPPLRTFSLFMHFFIDGFPYNLLTQMLRRGSFQATEMEVYKLAKVSNKRNRFNFRFDFLKIHLRTVYFMFKLLLTLRNGMSEVVEDEWLSG